MDLIFKDDDHINVNLNEMKEISQEQFLKQISEE